MEGKTHDINSNTALLHDRKGFDSFTLKTIAILGMTMNHFSIVFSDYIPLWTKCVLYSLGGLTFPIMAFLLCEGYRYTRSKSKYAVRLLVFALLSQIPYAFAIMDQFNVLFTLLLGLLTLSCIERIKSPVLCLIVIMGFTGISIFCDWGLMGIPMILAYFFIDNSKVKPVLPLAFPMIIMGSNIVMMLMSGNVDALPQLFYLIIGCVFTAPLISRYNGKRGSHSLKYAFYVFYPAHLTLLWLVRGFLYNNWGGIIHSFI